MQKKKGISLIVLVITIIVMMILAGAIILTLNNSGIIGKANEAVEVANLKQVQQVATLAWADAYAGGARSVDALKTAVDQALLDAKVDTNKYEITVTTSGVTVELKETTTPPTGPDEGGEGSGDTTPAQLSAPTISLSGDVLTITDNATNGSYTASFEIYVGSVKKATITASSTTTFDITTLELEAGTYNITVKAIAVEGTTITASVASTSVTYVVEEVSNIPEEWKASVTAIVDEVPIPKGFVASPYGADTANNIKAENTKAGGLVIYELTEDERTKGAKALPSNETRQTSWTTRNQYVWVPVDTATFDSTFVRKDFEMEYTLSSTVGDGEYWEVLPTTQSSTNNLKYMTEATLAEVQAMYASVRKYGGFYIARYEAGIDTQRTEQGTAANLPGIKAGTSVYSVMGKIPYTYIPWTWNNKMNEDANGAVEVARRMYPESNANYGVVSTLTYSVQWDITLQWFIDTGAMILSQVNTTEGSTAFGNYSDHVIAKSDLNDGAKVWDYSTSSSGSYVSKDSNTLTYPKASGKYWLLSTGALKVANINNIYDMAGNLDEWTVEGSYGEYRAGRGGGFLLKRRKLSSLLPRPNNS